MAKFLNVKIKDPSSVLKVGGARRTGAAPFVLEDNEGTRRLIKGQILENLGEVKEEKPTNTNQDKDKDKGGSNSKGESGGKAGGKESIKFD